MSERVWEETTLDSFAGVGRKNWKSPECRTPRWMMPDFLLLEAFDLNFYLFLTRRDLFSNRPLVRREIYRLKQAAEQYEQAVQKSKAERIPRNI